MTPIITSSRVFRWSGLAVVAGTAAAAWSQMIAGIAPALCLSLAVAAVAAAIIWRRPYLRPILLIGACFFLALWRFGIVGEDRSLIRPWYGRTATIAGQVAAAPDEREASVRIVLAVDSIKSDGEAPIAPAGLRLLIFTDQYPRFAYGDRVIASGRIEKAGLIGDFDWGRYLSIRGIDAVVYYPELKVVGDSERRSALTALIRMRDAIAGRLERGLSPSTAGLARAFILGDRSGLADGLQLDFSRTGLAHITSVSGFHVGIIAVLGLEAALFLGLDRRFANLVTGTLLAAYVALVGAPASALRAGIMGALALIAITAGRSRHPFNALVFAAAGLLIYEPFYIFDLGWQLSFASLLGLIVVYPRWQGVLPEAGWSRPLLQVLFATIAAQAFSLPLIIYNFNVLSLVSPIANLAVLWVLPAVMAALIAGAFLHPLVGAFLPVWWPAEMLLRFVVMATAFLGRLPGAYLEISRVAWYYYAGYYLAVICALYYQRLAPIAARIRGVSGGLSRRWI